MEEKLHYYSIKTRKGWGEKNVKEKRKQKLDSVRITFTLSVIIKKGFF